MARQSDRFNTTIYVVTALLVGGCSHLLAQSAWTDISRVYNHACRDSSNRWTVCGLFQMNQMQPSAGGPQALEGYTYVGHQTGTVGLAMGVIGNVEVGGPGAVTDVRALQAGIVVSGPGQIERAASLVLITPKSRGDYTGPVNVKEADYILFDNGSTIRPDDDGLILCDKRGRCHSL